MPFRINESQLARAVTYGVKLSYLIQYLGCDFFRIIQRGFLPLLLVVSLVKWFVSIKGNKDTLKIMQYVKGPICSKASVVLIKTVLGRIKQLFTFHLRLWLCHGR